MKPWTIPFHLDVLKALGRYVNASANYVAYSGRDPRDPTEVSQKA